MPSYQYLTQYDSPNYTPGRPYGNISFIVIHHWGVDGQAFMTPVNHLCSRNSGTSAHYVATAGKVACIVAPGNIAWHAGNWDANCRSIGIECHPEMTSADMETVAELIAELRKTYGNLPLYPHKKYTATVCPGRWEARLAWLSARADQIRNGAKPATSKPATTTPATPTPQPSGGTQFNVKITTKELRIRKGPGTNYAFVQYIKPGTYTIVETKKGQGSSAGWGRLKSGLGWISLDYATRMDIAGGKQPAQSPQPATFKVAVSIPDLNIRKGAGTNYASVRFCPKGIYTITEVKSGAGSNAGWGKLKSGEGWISLDYVTRV